jgi:hypothetical protein
MGFHHIKTNIFTLKKGVRRAVLARPMLSGDIILANHISYIDLIYLWTFYSPVFTVNTGTGVFLKTSFWKALGWDLGQTLNLSSVGKGMALLELADWAKKNNAGPIVIFPEGTTSNGRGLLKFTSIFPKDLAKLPFSLHVLGFRYTYTNFAPCFTSSSSLSHIFQLCAQFQNDLEVKQLSSLDVDEVLDSTEDKATMEERIRLALGQMLRLRLTNLGLQDKQEFLEYYQQKESKKYKKN